MSKPRGGILDGWHFPRIELAEHYLGVMGLGITSHFAIVAPRRKGKTLFVLQDLAPASSKRQYRPVYASLWQNINAPHEGLTSALEEAVNAAEKGAGSRLLNTTIKRAAISNEMLGSMEIEFAGSPVKAASKDLTHLDQLLSKLQKAAGKKKVLLLIDEVQHLSTSHHFDPLAHALRTMLDKRQGEVKSIFTGSSRHYMDLLFNEAKSPFYHFVETLPFPDLDHRFVEFLRAKLARDYNMPVPVQPLQKAFLQFDNSPYWMMKLVEYLITYKSTVPEALDYVSALMEAAEGYETVAKAMKPIDKLVFLTLCDNKNPFAKELMAKIDQETNVKGIPSNIQRAIRRLLEANLVSQLRKGEYIIEKPGLRKYLSGPR